MKILLAILLVLCMGCGISITKIDENITTTLTNDEILVEWVKDGLHRRFWIDISGNPYDDWYAVAYLKERHDGYVDHYSASSFWDRNIRINASPWANK